MSEAIRYELLKGGVSAITLARPDKRNALSAEMFEELAEVVERAGGDESARCVLVRGEGPSFCAGIDVAAFVRIAGAQEQFPEFIARAQRGFRALATLPKPTVAAVQGHALGAGFQLALACDLRVAAEDVSFGMLEIRFGLLPDLGGNGRLAALVGPAVAKELVWTGRQLDAAEAQRLGLANRVVAPAALEEESTALAEALAAAAPLPVRASKAIIDHAASAPIEDLMDEEARAQNHMLGSDDHREAVAAFFEKRAPEFRGS